MFQRLTELVEPVLIPLPAPSPDESKMHAMSRGHKAVAERMFADQALGIFIYPDTVFADGALAAVKEHANSGRKVVLAFCPRFANEGFIEALRVQDRTDPDVPLNLSARELVDMAIQNMHSETRTYNFEAPYFSLRPVMCSWPVADGSGLVFHTTNWAPILVDYEALTTHDVDTLEDWTIDGDYIYRNFPNTDDIHIASHINEIVLISFTPEGSLTHLPLRPEPVQRLPLIGPWFRSMALRSFLHSHEIDPQKRELFPISIKVKCRDGNDADWKKAVSIGVRIATHAAADPMKNWERRAFIILRILNEGIFRHLAYWVRKRRST